MSIASRLPTVPRDGALAGCAEVQQQHSSPHRCAGQEAQALHVAPQAPCPNVRPLHDFTPDKKGRERKANTRRNLWEPRGRHETTRLAIVGGCPFWKRLFLWL
ncbi:hypothetical protein PsYK624_074360 [Phanerochaete sordida]|uniref:Uncharacterized protein n=1 Tax=Phanerochaete sordida TaxID=48140 RepID=A0A9P3LES2_9APHY|nr:hypothetical protein PsYK624_074360 [Phanerochaete sordida]